MDKPAIFFDNDSGHIGEVQDCRRIHCVKVPGIDGLPGYSTFTDIPDEVFTDHILNASPNMINFLIWVNGGERDLFDPTSGITGEHVDILRQWLEESENNRERYAIFDFDRTITKIEGFGLIRDGMAGLSHAFMQWANSEASGPITAEEYMTYLCGESRIPLLRNMFEMCIENYVKIVILTNNGACINDPQIIRDFMSVLGVTDFTLLCSRTRRSDKGRTLHEELEEVCPTLLGGRKKRYSRSVRS